ncbi:MAG: MFS transporter [Candidatus Bathyarchaeia archaeon]
MQIIPKLREEFYFIRGNYLVIVMSWILIDFAMELQATYYGPFVLYDLGATETILGLIGFVSLIGLALVQFPGGYLADRYGRRWLISTLTFGVALSYIFYMLAPSWHWILVGALFGNFCSFYMPALEAMLADSTPSERRGMGFSIISLITKVATTPAPIFAGLLVTVFARANGMRIAYAIVVILFLIAATLRVKLKETVAQPGKIRFRDLLNSYPRAIKESIGVWKTLPHSMFYLFFVNLTVTFAISLGLLYYAVYAIEGSRSVLFISEFDWALVSTAIFVAMIFSAIPIGKFIDKIGRKIPLLASYVIFFPAVLLFVYGDLFRLFIALPLIGIGDVLFFSAFASLQTDLVPLEKRGKVIGLTNFTTFIVAAIGQLIGGILYERAPQLPFFLVLVFMVPSFIITLRLHEPKRREE